MKWEGHGGKWSAVSDEYRTRQELLLEQLKKRREEINVQKENKTLQIQIGL